MRNDKSHEGIPRNNGQYRIQGHLGAHVTACETKTNISRVGDTQVPSYHRSTAGFLQALVGRQIKTGVYGCQTKPITRELELNNPNSLIIN